MIDEQQLEEMASRALGDLPPCPAPHGLETRVFDELRRRAAEPWWRRSVGHWPLPAQAAFLATSIASIVLLLWSNLAPLALAQARILGAPALLLGQSLATAAASIDSVVAPLLRLVPAVWVYVGVGFAATLYALLLGLGATAYCALHVQRFDHR